MPGQTLRVQGFEATEFQDNRDRNLAGSSALSTSRLYPTVNIPGTQFL